MEIGFARRDALRTKWLKKHIAKKAHCSQSSDLIPFLQREWRSLGKGHNVLKLYMLEVLLLESNRRMTCQIQKSSQLMYPELPKRCSNKR